MALLRYPGSKEKLIDIIWPRFPESMVHELWSNALTWEYREPFFGGGAVGLDILKRLSPKCSVWINDIDPGVIALWESIRNVPDDLVRLVSQFEPTSEAFYRFRNEDGDSTLPQTEAGFRKLALHRISFSGLGAKAGGPIGGKDQDGAKYTVGCRWNPDRIKNQIGKFHKMLSRFPAFRCTCGDFTPLIETAPRKCFIYVDPPYYENGPKLYKYHFSEGDHVRLAGLLRKCQASWVLSYDDHPVIKELYSWALIEQIDTIYTTANYSDGLRPKHGEVIITPRRSDQGD
jgi:DNA adenine methylase